MIGKYFEEFMVGDEFVTPSRTVTEADLVSFSGLSGDYSPHHTDAEFCKTLPFRGRIAHGPLVVSICSGLVVSLNLWRETAIALMEVHAKFRAATNIGDTIRVTIRVSSKKESTKGDKGIVTFDQFAINQRKEVLAEIQWVLMIITKKST